MNELAVIAAGLALVVLVQWIWIARLRGQRDDANDQVDALNAALGAHVDFLEVRRKPPSRGETP